MIRLQKLLAEAGLGSRRTIEEWIRAGRVTAGGQVARLGDRATGTDGGPRREEARPQTGGGRAGRATPLLQARRRPPAAPGGTAVRSKPRSAPPGRRLPDGGSAAPPAAEPPRRPAT